MVIRGMAQASSPFDICEEVMATTNEMLSLHSTQSKTYYNSHLSIHQGL